MEQITSLEIHSHWSIQEIHGLLWHAVVNCLFHKSLLLDRIQNRMNPVDIQLISLRSIVVFHLFFKGTLTFRFSDQSFARVYFLSCMVYGILFVHFYLSRARPMNAWWALNKLLRCSLSRSFVLPTTAYCLLGPLFYPRHRLHILSVFFFLSLTHDFLTGRK